GLLPNLSSMDGTDSHLWFGWRGGRPEDLAAFLARLPRAARFVSDFGAWSCSCPPEGEPPADDPAWSILLRNVPRDVFDSDDDWCFATQQEQATVLRTQIEILRRLKYRPTGGFAFSQLADGRGEIGAGVLDRERRPKAAWEAVASACKPVIVTA